jgi:hypothetical protein
MNAAVTSATAVGWPLLRRRSLRPWAADSTVDEWRRAQDLLGNGERERGEERMRERDGPGRGLEGGGPTRLRVERGRAEEAVSAQVGTAQLIEPG